MPFFTTPQGQTLSGADHNGYTNSDENANEAILIEELPSSKKFAGEGAWQAALRFLHSKAQLSQPSLQLSNKVYTRSHSGLVQIDSLNQEALEWHADKRTSKCHLRLFLVEGEIKKTAIDLSVR